MKQDFLNRTEFVERIVDFVNTLSDMNKGATFAIDGKWGSGKTFVLEMLENKLRSYQFEEAASDKFLIANYNCWQYDYYEEPSVAMVSAILDSIDREERLAIDGKIKATWSLFKDDIKAMAGKFAENHIGINVVEIVDRIQSEEKAQQEKKTEFDPIFTFKKTLEEARETLSEIAKSKTIVLIVDELDRCMPPYAIKVLERLHHFFYGLDNVIVIVAVDSKQLTHSVKEIYGQELDEKGYLRKFIELTFQLDIGKIDGDIFEKYSSYFSRFNFASDYERECVEECFNNIWSGEDMRSQEKAMEKAEAIHNLITNEKVEAAVALYEMISVRFKDLREGDLSWILQYSQTVYPDIGKKLSGDALAYLKHLKDLAVTGSYTKTFSDEPTYYHLHNDIAGKCFYYFNESYPGRKHYKMVSGEGMLKENIIITKSFTYLLTVID